MNEAQRYEIACLADDLFTKRERLKALGTANTPEDADKRRAAMIEYEIARAEEMEAEARLGRAKTAAAHYG